MSHFICLQRDHNYATNAQIILGGHTGKPGPGTQRWDKKVGRKGGTQRWDAKVVRKGGTQRWDAKVGRKGGTQRWDAKVGRKVGRK